MEQTYCLTNGTLINIFNSANGNTKDGRISRSLNFSLYAEKDGKRVGLLTVENGSKVKTTYTGEINIEIVSDYLGLGIEKVFIRKLKQWLFCEAKNTKKANLKVQVNELLELEYLINIREII